MDNQSYVNSRLGRRSRNKNNHSVKQTSWFAIVITTLAIAAMTIPSWVIAAPKAKLIPFWQATDSASSITVDHQPWQQVLNTYLDKENASGINLFDYQGLNAKDEKLLDDYLSKLQLVDPRSLNRDEQFAYWVNLYNAKTIALVAKAVKKRNISSIRQIRSNFIWPGPWTMKVLNVAGKSLSLNDIEHGILRPIWQDHRIHFVVNCASIGCPSLGETAFTAANHKTLLALAEREFVNHPRAVTMQGEELILSKIFDWYSDDFASDTDELLQYLNSVYTGAELNSEVPVKVTYVYDWALNKR